MTPKWSCGTCGFANAEWRTRCRQCHKTPEGVDGGLPYRDGEPVDPVGKPTVRLGGKDFVVNGGMPPPSGAPFRDRTDEYGA